MLKIWFRVFVACSNCVVEEIEQFLVGVLRNFRLVLRNNVFYRVEHFTRLNSGLIVGLVQLVYFLTGFLFQLLWTRFPADLIFREDGFCIILEGVKI